MFGDRGRFDVGFLEADVLGGENYCGGDGGAGRGKGLEELHGKFDIVSVIFVLHQWGLEDQVSAVKQLLKLLRAEKRGSTVVGFQIGSLAARVTGLGTYRHDPDSFRGMWERAGRETGTRWSCDVQLRFFEDLGLDGEDSAYLGDDARILQFVVDRVA